MVPIILCITIGITAGYLLRNSNIAKINSKILNATIMLLLFFLGTSVGGSEQIISNFTTIGIDAFILTVGGTLGSLLCIKWVYHRFFNKEKK